MKKLSGFRVIVLLVLMGACVMSLSSCKKLQLGGGSKGCVVVWSEGTAPKDVYPNTAS